MNDVARYHKSGASRPDLNQIEYIIKFCNTYQTIFKFVIWTHIHTFY